MCVFRYVHACVHVCVCVHVQCCWEGGGEVYLDPLPSIGFNLNHNNVSLFSGNYSALTSLDTSPPTASPPSPPATNPPSVSPASAPTDIPLSLSVSKPPSSVVSVTPRPITYTPQSARSPLLELQCLPFPIALLAGKRLVLQSHVPECSPVLRPWKYWSKRKGRKEKGRIWRSRRRSSGKKRRCIRREKEELKQKERV